MPLHHHFTSVPRRTHRLLLVAALVGLSGALGSTQTSAATTDIETVTTVLINNTAAPYHVNYNDSPPCADPGDLPNTDGWWVKEPTRSPIVVGSATDWSFAGEPFFAWSDVQVCRSDAGKQSFHVGSGWDDSHCTRLNSGADECTPVDAGSPVLRLYRLGPKVDPQLVVTSSGKYVPGVPVTLTARLSWGSDEGAALVPRAGMHFDLGPNGSGSCSTVPVVGRIATCQAAFSGTLPQSVTASYPGDGQFLTGSGSTTVARLGPMVQAPYTPGSGPGWESGSAMTEYPFSNVPGTPLAIAASHDGKAMAAISNTGALYARVDNPLQNPQPDFTPMYGANGQPMIATAVTIDTNPVNGEVQLAVIGGDGRIWHRTKPRQGNWSAWGTPGPDFFQATDLSLSIDNSGTAHVAAIGLDHNINYRTRHPDGTWDGWQIVRDTLGRPVQGTKVAIAAATSGAAAGAVELDLIGYGAATSDHRVSSMSKAPGSSSWQPPREVLVSSAAPFTRLASGRFSTPLNGTVTDVGLVVATTGANAPVTRTLRTNTVWGDRANATVTNSGWSGLAISTTPNGQGIGFTTWH
jgi:hypothetical protein